MPDSARNNALKTAVVKTVKERFDGVIEIASEGGDALFIDGRANPPTVVNKKPQKAAARCVLRGAEDVLLRAFESERAFESAYVSGRLAISGDMSLMARMKLDAGR